MVEATTSPLSLCEMRRHFMRWPLTYYAVHTYTHEF